jgi:hypothetical protein
MAWRRAGLRDTVGLARFRLLLPLVLLLPRLAKTEATELARPAAAPPTAEAAPDENSLTAVKALPDDGRSAVAGDPLAGEALAGEGEEALW